jgi:hypothetical protein
MIPEFSERQCLLDLIADHTERTQRPWQYNLVITARQGRMALEMGLNPYHSWPIHGCSYMMVDIPPKDDE